MDFFVHTRKPTIRTNEKIDASTEESKQWLMHFHGEFKAKEMRHKQERNDMQQSWSRKHPTAHEQLPIDLISNELVTRNTKWLDVFVGDFFMGSWLNGRIFKKCRKIWLVIVKGHSEYFKRIKTTKEEAEAALLHVNS